MPLFDGRILRGVLGIRKPGEQPPDPFGVHATLQEVGNILPWVVGIGVVGIVYNFTR